MSYRGYAAAIHFDADDEIFFGRLGGIRDGIGFHADTVADLKAAFHAAVDDYIASCATRGRPAQRPYSGQIMVRVDTQVHADVAMAAELRGTSINTWVEKTLREAAKLETHG
jgi:predicted HicB family RNase H-like nuclease